jgi:hypothetical protein
LELVRGPAGRCRHPGSHGPPAGHQAIAAARVKNDAVDAKTLAHLLRTNLLAEAGIAPPDAREARRLVRTRAGLVRMRSRVQSQLPALLADLGSSPSSPPCSARPGAAGWPTCACLLRLVVDSMPACA